MPLPEHWATIEDFATLFQYFWHRDFPIDQRARGARRADWTRHIGIVIRNIGDLMGLYTRFETRGKTDAVLGTWERQIIAVEWEWGGKQGFELGKHNELKKLKKVKPFIRFIRDDSARKLEYAVLITYSDTQGKERESFYEGVKNKWEGAPCPLLLILIDFKGSKEFLSRREFININMSVFDSSGVRTVRRPVPALPWKVEGWRGYKATP